MMRPSQLRFVTKGNSSVRTLLGVFAGLLLLLALPVYAGAQTAHFSYAQDTLGASFPNAVLGMAVDKSGNLYTCDFGNSAVQEILAVGDYTALKTVASGINAECFGVAVDGSGNVFVADTDNNSVVEVLAAGGYTTVNTLGGGFSGPYGIAVDGVGNVFVADTGNSAIKEIPPGCISSACVHTVGSGFLSPEGVAVDGSGNLFVADTSNNAVKEILAAGGYVTINSLGSGFDGPTKVAVDGSGNVFVAEFLGGAVDEILAAGGYTTVNTLASGFNGPEAVAVDGSGNVFIADSFNARVVELATASADFGTVAVGQTSAVVPLTFTFDGGGSIGSPVVLTQGASGLDFAVASGGSCAAGTYSTGATCTVNVTFTPTVPGQHNGAVLLKNASGNTIATGYIHGIGSGPQVSFLPGSQSMLGGGFNGPYAVALDGSGNLFVADVNNNAIKEILAASGYTTVKTLASGLNGPEGVAVDGSGNVFFSETTNNAVKEMPFGCVTSSCIKTLGSGFDAPTGVAVDGSGNVFVADWGNNAVKEILAAGGYSTVISLGGGFSYPRGVAVDGSGNVFVADTNHGEVKEILAAGSYGTVNTLGGGFYVPISVAVDAAGNVYVSDTYINVLEEIPTGCVTAGCVRTLSNGFVSPWGIAVDGSGNVFVANSGSSTVAKVDFANPPSLSFATPTFVGSPDTADGPHTVTVQNIGNAPLTLPAPASGSNPSIAPNFTLDSSALTACAASAESLASGASCTLSIGFDPTASGTISGSLVLTDNALNAASPTYATQTIMLQGTGVLNPQSITFPNPGTQTYGVAPITLNATTTSGLAITYSVTSGPATVSGSTLTITGAGSVTVMVTQAGNGMYASAPPMSIGITVLPAPLSVTCGNVLVDYLDIPIPLLHVELAGVVTGDGITASCSTTAVKGSHAGEYSITPALLDPYHKLPNYSVTSTNGTLRIAPRQPRFCPRCEPVAPRPRVAISGNGVTKSATETLPSDVAKEKTDLVGAAKPSLNLGTSSSLPFAVVIPTPTISAASISDAADGNGNNPTGADSVSNSTVETSLPATVTVRSSTGISPGVEVP